MLISQYGCRHQYGHLLGVARRLEGSTHSDLRLAKPHIATDQAVHRTSLFHVSLDVVGSLQLVRGILIEERSLQFLLQERVGRIGKAFLLATGSIEFDEVTGYILQLLLGALLHAFPLACSQM